MQQPVKSPTMSAVVMHNLLQKPHYFADDPSFTGSNNLLQDLHCLHSVPAASKKSTKLLVEHGAAGDVVLHRAQRGQDEVDGFAC